MVSPQDRLIEIAQRLDELAGDDASELQTLSSELGEIAEKWPLASGGVIPIKKYEVPRWIYEMQRIMEGVVQEKLYRDYGIVNRTSASQQSMMQKLMVAEPAPISQMFTV